MPPKRSPDKKKTAPAEEEVLSVLSRLQELYREYESVAAPLRDCTGRADCCRFRLTGETPHLTLPEALLAWREWKRTGRTKISLPEDGSCPFLNRESRCLIYQARPFACRTHFCVAAGGALPRKSVQPFIHKLEDMDYELKGNGPSRLPDFITRLSKSEGRSK